MNCRSRKVSDLGEDVYTHQCQLQHCFWTKLAQAWHTDVPTCPLYCVNFSDQHLKLFGS